MEYKVLAADDETELLDALELYTERENIRLIKADNGPAAGRGGLHRQDRREPAG